MILVKVKKETPKPRVMFSRQLNDQTSCDLGSHARTNVTFK